MSQASSDTSGVAPGFFTQWQFDAKRSDLREPLLHALNLSWVYRNVIKSATQSLLEMRRDGDEIVLSKLFQLKDAEGRADNTV